jgi:hypothetical protein
VRLLYKYSNGFYENYDIKSGENMHSPILSSGEKLAYLIKQKAGCTWILIMDAAKPCRMYPWLISELP